MAVNNKQVDLWIQQLTVLVVDDNQFMRKLVRGLLLNIGVNTVLEAADGLEALEEIRNSRPDMVILDWEMPLLNGPELVRIVRSPGAFPSPDIPIIMLTAFGERRRILESVQIGVNEFLCKPVSAKALYDRIVSILVKPRQTVQLGDYYGPAPRRPITEMEAAAGLHSDDFPSQPASLADMPSPDLAPVDPWPSDPIPRGK
ncbi:MAG TPA: response regulator [Pseudolabrys sp.]|jgi:CheY-like chemotaxis protein|nr:response regulator [Pseudolabrys sp.]